MRVITILLLLFFSFFHVSVCLAEIISIKVPKANIRSGPGTNYKVNHTVGKFFPLQILKKKGDWYRVKDFEGDIGWVYRKLTSKTPAVVVKTRKKVRANVRYGAGKKYKRIFQAARGSAFKLVKKSGNWIKIKHADGDTGWIYKKLLWGL